MSPSFAACPSCARHVKTTEAACPFCAVPLGSSWGPRLEPKLPPVARLTRAALVAFGAAAVTSAAACGGSIQSSDDAGSTVAQKDAGNVGAPDATVTEPDASSLCCPPYGISPPPPPEDAGSEPPLDAAYDVVVVTVPYGVPPGHP